MRQRLIRNIVSNYLGFAVNAVVMFLLTPFLIQKLGDSSFGIWVLLNVILSYFQLMEFGIVPSVVRFVSFHQAREEKCEIESAIGTAIVLLGIPGLLTIPIIFIVAKAGPSIFSLDAEDGVVFSDAAWFLGITAVLTYFKRLFFAVIEGYQRFDLLNISSASASILGAGLTVYSVSQGGGIVALTAILMLQTAYEVVFEAAVIVKVFALKPDIFAANQKNREKIFAYSYYAYLIDIAVSIAYKIDTLVIGAFLPAAAITYYSIGTRIAGMLEKAIDPLVNVFFPMASDLDARGNPEPLQKLFIHGTRLSILSITPAAILLYLYGAELIAWWIGAQYVASALPILQIFLAVVLLSVFEAAASRILLGIGQVRFEANVSLFVAAANLLLSLSLVKSYGMVGVALGTLIPLLVCNLAISIPYTCKQLGVAWSGFYFRTLSPSLAIVAASLACHKFVDALGISLFAGATTKVALISIVSILVIFRIGNERKSAV